MTTPQQKLADAGFNLAQIRDYPVESVAAYLLPATYVLCRGDQAPDWRCCMRGKRGKGTWCAHLQTDGDHCKHPEATAIARSAP